MPYMIHSRNWSKPLMNQSLVHEKVELMSPDSNLLDLGQIARVRQRVCLVGSAVDPPQAGESTLVSLS